MIMSNTIKKDTWEGMSRNKNLSFKGAVECLEHYKKQRDALKRYNGGSAATRHLKYNLLVEEQEFLWALVNNELLVIFGRLYSNMMKERAEAIDKVLAFGKVTVNGIDLYKVMENTLDEIHMELKRMEVAA